MDLETATLITLLMGLRKMKAADLARKARVSRASLSKFLNGESDLRSASLMRISSALGVSFESTMKAEINRGTGQGQALSIGEDIQFLLNQAQPIDRRTYTDTLIAKFKNERDLDTKARVARLKKYRDSIKTIRRN